MKYDKNSLSKVKMGAICGDVVGSIYEWNNIRYRLPEEKFITETSRFTDDTVMTCAVARGLTRGLRKLPRQWWTDPDAEERLRQSVGEAVLEFGLKYPEAGYGSSFIRWMESSDHAPYNSWGNGSAMRVSYAGWLADSLEEAERLGEISASVTHNHPEGMKGAKVVAGCLYLLRAGKGKQGVQEYASRFYDLGFTIDGIRDSYVFDVSCAGSVPQGIKAFLEEDSYAGAIASGISIGGDSDTIAAIAGCLAEVIYPIPERLRLDAASRLDDFLLDAVVEASDFLEERMG